VLEAGTQNVFVGDKQDFPCGQAVPHFRSLFKEFSTAHMHATHGCFITERIGLQLLMRVIGFRYLLGTVGQSLGTM
jgi:hypothetical protein